MAFIDKKAELLAERNKVYSRMKELQENEEFTAEQRAEWDKLNTRYDEIEAENKVLDEKAQRAERLDSIRERSEEDSARVKTEIGQSRQERAVRRGEEAPSEEQRCLAMQGWLMRDIGISLTERHNSAIEVVNGFGSEKGFSGVVYFGSHRSGLGMWSSADGEGVLEKRAASTTLASGGYTIPEGFQAELEEALQAYGGFRRICRIISTGTGNDVPWPKVDDTGNTGELLAEAGSIGSSTDPVFSNIVLKAYKYSSKPVLASSEILQDSAFNLAAEFGAMLGERIGRITATHFATGDNSDKPQGITTATTLGVTAAGAAAITADELIQLQDSLDAAYKRLPSIGWAMNKATLTKVRLLKSESSQYIWQPGLTLGTPDMLLGHPVAVIEEMPASTTGNKSILFGAFEKYIIRDVASARFFRLEELYRANDQTGFVMFSRHDGRMLQGSAIKHLIQA